ncbi:MAG: GGDEF domain-containing protein [Bacilli bacterium]|nr:GGDEF domain-containing protein [Bacilli bacterium]
MMKTEELDKNVLASLTAMYHSMHIIDIKNDEFIEYAATKYVHKIYENIEKASEMISAVANALSIPEFIDIALEFADLSTVAERLKDKKVLTGDFIGLKAGWIRSQFLPLEYDKDGSLKSVIFTTRVINEEKIKEQMLLKMSNTDNMTMLANRRAFDAFLESTKDNTELGDYTIVSLDVNGLKLVNDTLGHQAGDELIKLTADAIRSVFGKYGDTYRTGGDEFIAVLHGDPKKLDKIKKDFYKYASKLNGEYIDNISVSLGVALALDHKNMTMEQLWKEADVEMYKDKEKYYHEMGLKRRGLEY